jgi:hypothetical protein
MRSMKNPWFLNQSLSRFSFSGILGGATKEAHQHAQHEKSLVFESKPVLIFQGFLVGQQRVPLAG